MMFQKVFDRRVYNDRYSRHSKLKRSWIKNNFKKSSIFLS